MVVVAVLAILASIALPSFNYLATNTRVKSAATDYYLAFLRARSEAVKRNRTVAVVPTDGSDWANGIRVFSDSSTTSAGTYDRLVYEVASLNDSDPYRPKRVTVTPASSITRVIYLTSGRATASPTFRITTPKVNSVRRCLSVDLTGRPYIAKAGENGC